MTKRTTHGFTLLEMLVVLTFIGLMSALVAPDLMTMTDRVAYAMTRERLERTVASLPYEAFRLRKDIILASTEDKYGETPQIDESLNLSTADESFKGSILRPILAEDAKIDLPPDWRLVVENPILFRSAGYCTGGTIEVQAGTARYVYDLKAPDCRLIVK